MATTTNNQWSITKYDQDTHLLTWIEAFLVDRKAQGLSEGTLYFYQKKLKLFIECCEAQANHPSHRNYPELLERVYVVPGGYRSQRGGKACLLPSIEDLPALVGR